MNDWQRKNRPLVIAEADDFCDKYDRSGLEMLFYWKAKYPNFKITLFTIPNKISDTMLDLLKDQDWLEFAVHGFDHDSNYECWSWDYEKTKALMHRTYHRGPLEYGESGAFKKIFKAAGWTITDKYSGYKASEELPIAKDPQAVYRALQDMDFIIFDRHYDKPARPAGAKIVCVDCNTDIVHMHTWDMMGIDKNGRNGFRQVEEEHGVPWDNNTEFYFISEAWERGLFKLCKE